MTDYIIRAGSKNGDVRAFACTSRTMVDTAQKIHDTSEVSSAALGRTLTAAAMVGVMQKNDDDLITISFKSDGPIGGIIATSDNKARVKGYAFNNNVKLPLKENGKIDVSGALGKGYMRIIKDLGMKDPYIGQIPIQTGEIAEDLTYYFAQSEQTPSVVALGVLVNEDYSIKQAGGFIIQLLPEATEETIVTLEENIDKLDSITQMLDNGKSPEEILTIIFGELGIVFYEQTPIEYYCNCSKERVETALMSMGREELETIIKEDKKAEVNCHFCKTDYNFSEADLIKLLG